MDKNRTIDSIVTILLYSNDVHFVCKKIEKKRKLVFISARPASVIIGLTTRVKYYPLENRR